MTYPAIENIAPRTGRLLGEGSQVLNVADLLRDSNFKDSFSVMPFRMRAISQGYSFCITTIIPLQAGQIISYQMHIPTNRQIWMDPAYYSVSGTGPLYVSFIRDPVIGVPGFLPVIPINFNENSDITAELDCWYPTDGVSGGVDIDPVMITGSTNSGMYGNPDIFLIPRAGSTYVGKLQNGGMSEITVGVKLVWFEFPL